MLKSTWLRLSLVLSVNILIFLWKTVAKHGILRFSARHRMTFVAVIVAHSHGVFQYLLSVRFVVKKVKIEVILKQNVTNVWTVAKWNRLSPSATSTIQINKAQMNPEWEINGAEDTIAPDFPGLCHSTLTASLPFCTTVNILLSPDHWFLSSWGTTLSSAARKECPAPLHDQGHPLREKLLWNAVKFLAHTLNFNKKDRPRLVSHFLDWSNLPWRLMYSKLIQTLITT